MNNTKPSMNSKTSSGNSGSVSSDIFRRSCPSLIYRLDLDFESRRNARDLNIETNDFLRVNGTMEDRKSYSQWFSRG